MRLNREDTLKRAKFVINLFAANPDMTISEVRRLVQAQFEGQSMNYKLLQRYKSVVDVQREKMMAKEVAAKALQQTVPAMQPPAQPTETPAVAPTPPVEAKNEVAVSVWTPPEKSDLGPEFLEGLKLIKSAIYKKGTGGNVSIAARDGKIEVSAQLSLAKTEDTKFEL